MPATTASHAIKWLYKLNSISCTLMSCQELRDAYDGKFLLAESTTALYWPSDIKQGRDFVNEETRQAMLAYYEALARDGGFSARCDLPLPDGLVGKRVLDVGCRAGKGVCKIADAVGPSGFVLGVDPSPAFIERARKTCTAPHVAFACVPFEDLHAVGVEDASFDVVIVNSVLNLAWDRPLALTEIARALVPGGLLWHSGLFAIEHHSARIPGNVFAAASTCDEFAAEARAAGFSTCEFGESRPAVPLGSDAAPELKGTSFITRLATLHR